MVCSGHVTLHPVIEFTPKLMSISSLRTFSEAKCHELCD